MRRSVRLLAVSRMEGGFCIAGIPENSSAWVRPIKRLGHISERDLVDAKGRLLMPLDLVTFDFTRHKPSVPHIEDWLADFFEKPVIQHRPSDEERETMLEGLAVDDPDDVLVKKVRSLVLIEPDQIHSTVFDPRSLDGTYKVRLSFTLRGRVYEGESASAPGYPCTDLRLRNWGRRFTSRRVLNERDLREALGAQRIFLALGLTRPYNDNCWPMVVGVHTCPDFSATIDLSNP